MDNIKTRDMQDAQRLFESLQNDLDPLAFTIDEIVDEGWDNRSSVNGFGLDTMPEDNRKARAKRLLNYLIREGLVEKSDEDEDVFCLTQTGYEQRF